MSDDKQVPAVTREIPALYINGFDLSITSADIRFNLTLDGQPMQVLHLSYTLSKTLVEKLGQVMRDFEAATQNEIMTTDAVNSHMKSWSDRNPQ